MSAKSVAEATVELWINVFTVPAKIHTDRGKAPAFNEKTGS